MGLRLGGHQKSKNLKKRTLALRGRDQQRWQLIRQYDKSARCRGWARMSRKGKRMEVDAKLRPQKQDTGGAVTVLESWMSLFLVFGPPCLLSSA